MSGLAKTLVPVAFGQGIKTKIDIKHQVLGTYRKARNVIFETLNSFRKRNGYTFLPLKTLSGSSLLDIEAISVFKAELLVYEDNQLYAYSPTRDRAISRGALYHAKPTSTAILNNAYNHDSVDSLVVSGFAVYVYHNSTTSQVRYSVEDLSNGAFLVSNALVATGTMGRVAAINNTVYLLYGDSTNIRYKSFNIFMPSTLSSATTLANNYDASSAVFDARGSSTQVIVAYNSTDASAYVKLASIGVNGSPGGGQGISSSEAATSINLLIDSLSRVVVAWTSADKAWYAISNAALNAFTLDKTELEEFSLNATATINVDTDIILTSVAAGQARNNTTFQLVVNAAAPNTLDEVLVTFSGTASAIICTITPNDGTNNSGQTVFVQEDELAELINTGAIAGKTVVLTDGDSLRNDQTATGGASVNLTSADNQTVTFSGAIPGLQNIDVLPVNSIQYNFQYEVQATQTHDHYVKQNTGTAAGAVGTPSVFKRSVGLAAKSFRLGGENFSVLVYGSALQSTYFVADSDANIVAKMQPGLAGSIVSTSVLPTSWVLSASEAFIPSLIKTRNAADNGTFFSLLGINKLIVDMEPTHKYTDTLFADNLHIAGGYLQMYDGSSVVEHGFHVFPEAATLSSAATSGGFMSDGSYGFQVVYKWTDNVGQDHRSAPSVDFTYELAGGGSTQTVTIKVPTLRLTQKSDVIIELYQTEDDGTQYYLTNTVLNDVTQDFLTITASKADATLITQEALYTTGNVLENIAPPSVSVIGTHTAANRLVVVGEESNKIIYSKIRFDGKPVEFSDALQKDIDPIGGIITAIASMDEKLVVFERQAILYIGGAGPLNTGEQDTYTEPERISIDVGCIDPVSVVLVPQGLMFKSVKGIYLLGRDLSVQYIGADVEAYNSLTITSAELVPAYNEARFTTSGGDCLVYNYFTATWATNSNFQGRSAAIIGDTYHYVRSDGQVFSETTEGFSDNGSSINIDVETGWINLTPLQGFQRLYKILVLADYKSPHLLKVEIAYDYNDAVIQSVIIDPEDFLEGTAYGDDSPYGSGTPYGGTGNAYYARIDVKRQKCTAFKLRITDLQAVTGEGLSLSGFTLQIGAKKGTNKLASSQQFGLD